jgi:hypothetical protein
MLCRKCIHLLSIPKLWVSIVPGLCCSPALLYRCATLGPRCTSGLGGSQ